jgi:endonuclease YncB( thermonuclease family)
MVRICLSFGLVLALVGCIASEAPDGPARVLDGDTLVVGAQTIRLHGIDAPELDQTCQDDAGAGWPCGHKAKATLTRLIGAQPVTCTPRDRDRFGRLVARCSVGGADIGAQMVEAGMALAYRRYSRAYVPHETRAKAARRGLHAGQFTRPEIHRHARAGQAPKTCRIKGNITRAGDRIYHRPEQKHYARTRISASRGERWFCSEREAQKAGWRAAKSPAI